jgi:hypothetical protein
MNNNIDKDTLSLRESADFLGVTYGNAYTLIVQLNQVSYYDYATKNTRRNIRVIKQELEEYKKSKLIKAKIE